MDLPTADGEGSGNSGTGRRGNGLSAPAYGVLAQCEPQIAAALLTSLAEEGIAAYAMPYEGSVGGYLEMHPPVRPLARIWVDAAAMPAARTLLESRYPLPAEPPAVAEDSAWREIVAALRRPGPDGPVPWPDAENVGGRAPATPQASTAIDTPTTAVSMPVSMPVPTEVEGSPAPEAEHAAEWAGELDDEWDEDHFVPPPPPPVPVPRGRSAYGIAALVAGCLILLVPALAGDPVGPGLLLLAITAIVGGFVTLVAGMREGPPTDSDSDDGAVL